MQFFNICETCFISQILYKNKEIGILIHGYKSTGISNGEAWKFVPGKTETPGSGCWTQPMRQGLRASGWQQAGRVWKAG